jgi:hypothetical protein
MLGGGSTHARDNAHMLVHYVSTHVNVTELNPSWQRRYLRA